MTDPTVTYRPEGAHTITPHLVVRGAAEAAAWYARVLGAEERAGGSRCRAGS